MIFIKINIYNLIMKLITCKNNTLIRIFNEDFSSLSLIPKVERLINKQDPTLEDVLGLCSHNESLLEKLTRRGGVSSKEDEFAKEILFKKGLSFLKSLAIRTMNQEIFKLPLNLHGVSESILKRRSILLARFIKHYHDLLELSPDNAYLCGLLFNFNHICYEQLVNNKILEVEDYDNIKAECAHWTAQALLEIGFDQTITTFVEDSYKDLYSTSFPFAQALARIGNQLLIDTEQSLSSSIGRSSVISRDLLDATGLSSRAIVNVLKDLTRNYKGGVSSL